MLPKSTMRVVTRFSILFLTCSAALLSLVFGGGAAPARAAGTQTYLALGDSFGFGFTTLSDALATGPTLADQGYVRPFADFLGAQNGGVRPNVINLSLAGETSSSFFGLGASGTLLNLNYAPAFNKSQAQLVAERIAAEHAAGRTINNVTVQVGGNDLLALVFNPAFQAATPQNQAMQLNNVLLNVQSNYAATLNLVRTQAPEARIFAMGYFDPFPGLGPLNPFPTLSGSFAQALNGALSGTARGFGASFVDIYPDFVGKETLLTNITQPLDPSDPKSPPNYHPNAAGYRVIAARLQATASVPEPSALALFAGGLLPLAGVAFSRRRRCRSEA